MRSIFGGQKHWEKLVPKVSLPRRRCRATLFKQELFEYNISSNMWIQSPDVFICWVGDGCELYCFRQTELPTVAVKKGDKRHCAHCAHFAHCIVLIVIVVVFCLSDKFFKWQFFFGISLFVWTIHAYVMAPADSFRFCLRSRAFFKPQVGL